MRIETRVARAAAAIIALIGWVGLAVQLGAVTEQVGSAAEAVWIMLRFFTILTNLVVAVVLTGIALGQPTFRSQSLLGLMTLSILFVGAVYVLLLRGLVELSGGAAIANLILHYIVPGLVPLFWLLFVPQGRPEMARSPVLVHLSARLFCLCPSARRGGRQISLSLHGHSESWLGISCHYSCDHLDRIPPGRDDSRLVQPLVGPGQWIVLLRARTSKCPILLL